MTALTDGHRIGIGGITLIDRFNPFERGWVAALVSCDDADYVFTVSDAMPTGRLILRRSASGEGVFITNGSGKVIGSLDLRSGEFLNQNKQRVNPHAHPAKQALEGGVSAPTYPRWATLEGSTFLCSWERDWRGHPRTRSNISTTD